MQNMSQFTFQHTFSANEISTQKGILGENGKQ